MIVLKCILIDFGSTFIKYSIYNSYTDKILLSDKIKFPDPIICDSSRYIVSKNKIDESVFSLMEIAKKNECKKLFISVQMHGYILKYNNGNFSDYISWRDKSGDISIIADYNINFIDRGTSLKNNLPFVKLCCNKETTYNCEFFTLGSYISYILTGNNTTHKTDACASGFFDAKTLNPLPYPLKEIILPTVKNEISCVGRYENIDVYSPCGDHQVSFYGINENDFYLLNIGTATQLSYLENENCIASSCEKRPYFDDNNRVFTVSGLVGGDVLFKKNSFESLINEIDASLKKLPKKTKFVFAGGGAELAYEKISSFFNNKGFECKLLNKNAGLEGLIKMVKKTEIKKGVMVSEIPFINLPLIFKNNDLNFFIIDTEHGAFDYSTVSAMITNATLCSIPSIIRLSDNTRMNITKYSDAGANGFILPMTNSPEDIIPVIKYAKYSPIGKRGISTMRAHTLYNPPPLKDYMNKANEKLKVYAQIETVEGIKNINEIITVNGLEGVFIGPNDLSCDLDCIGDNKPVIECIEIIASACKKANKTWGIITTDIELISVAKQNNVKLISYGSELNILNNGCKTIKEKI